MCDIVQRDAAVRQRERVTRETRAERGGGLVNHDGCVLATQEVPLHLDYRAQLPAPGVCE